MKRLLTLSLILSTAVACSKDEDKKSGEASGTTASKAAPAEPAKLEYKPLAWMGLQAEVPAGAEISDTSADAPNASISIYSADGQSGCTAMISTVTAAYGSFESSVKEADEGVGNKAETWVKKEQTADGFHLEFTGKSLMGDPITDITIRRKIGDKEVQCSRAGSAEEVACVAPICASLKPL